VTEIKSTQYILDIAREYSIYVCENRSIPKLCDGLKDGQRRMLWTIRNKSDKVKTISLAGDAISVASYLHSDTSASGTISQMAGPYVNNIPILDGIGNFGTRVAPTEFAAPRYTYVKKGKAATELVFRDMEIIPMRENYDGSQLEPKHFLPIVPLVLLNGVSGIAVGWSTEILPRSLDSLIKACKDVLDGKKISRITPYYHNYDLDVKHLEDNTWEFGGKVEIVDASTLKVTELPPDLSLDKFKERLNSYEDENKISTYTDRSTDQISITIKMPRGSIKLWTVGKALDFLKLRQKKTERVVVLDWEESSVRQYDTAEKVIVDFVNWRLTFYEKRYQYRKAKDEYELGFWKGLKICFDKKLPAKLASIKSRKDLESEIKALTNTLNLDDKQIDRITNLPAYRWTMDAYQEVLDKIAYLENEIKIHDSILASPEKRKEIYKNELTELSKIKW
jgi:DNA gyrase/topoisomerase IV subunit A